MPITSLAHYILIAKVDPRSLLYWVHIVLCGIFLLDLSFGSPFPDAKAEAP